MLKQLVTGNGPYYWNGKNAWQPTFGTPASLPAPSGNTSSTTKTGW